MIFASIAIIIILWKKSFQKEVETTDKTSQTELAKNFSGVCDNCNITWKAIDVVQAEPQNKKFYKTELILQIKDQKTQNC